MPYSRKYKKPNRRYNRRYNRRFKRNTQMVKHVRSNIHYFKRSHAIEYDLTMSASIGAKFEAIPSYITAGPVNVYNDFELAYIPNYSEFTALYDSYKICGIKVKYIFSTNTSEIGTNAGLPEAMPNLYTVNDFNTPSALTTEDQCLQYASCKLNRLNQIITRYFRPTQEIDTSSGSIVKSRWNDTADTAIQHHGLLAAYTGYNWSGDGTTLGRLKIITTYYIAFRSPK